MGGSDLSPEARRRALKRKLAGIRGKLTVVKRQIAEIKAQEKPTTDIPGLFGQQAPSHPGLFFFSLHHYPPRGVLFSARGRMRRGK